MLTLSITTPEGQVLEREVDEVTVPGAEGEFGVLEGHIPFISACKAGVLAFRQGTERGKVAVGPGFVEVDGKGGVTVLVQRAALAKDVDAAVAERARLEAEEQLKKAGADEGAQRLARDDLAWAEAQLAVR